MLLYLKRAVFFLLLMIFTAQLLLAQQLPLNIEKLSDVQLLQLATQYQLVGLSESELEEKAREKGLSSDQITLLRKRMASMDADGAGSLMGNNIISRGNKSETYTKRNKIYPSRNQGRSDSTAGLSVFGSEIFGNTDLSFEPNLSIATPANYLIGVNDQIIIDIFGVSDNTRKLKVTPEGFIRFPNYGPIRVMGLSFEQARIKIKNELSKIYPALNNGSASIQISLGELRSIHITLLGEVVYPGRYTISSLSTLMNALYLSNGPNKIGSLRNIELIRNGKVLVNFDLYDFLLKADLSKNILLQDEDIIRIAPYNKRVVLMGAVKKPAIFDLTELEGIPALLKYAGGFADIAYKERFRLTRLGASRKEIYSLSYADLQNFSIRSGDTLAVDALANGYNNRVIINGAVYYGGVYGLNSLPTLKDLLMAAQPKEDAFRNRATIRRFGQDHIQSLLHFNMDEVLNGQQNIPLFKEDSVYIFSQDELKEKYAVTISGEVNKPGSYAYFNKMTVQDLILVAGGYTDGASLEKIEVSRRLRQGFSSVSDTNVYAIITEIDLTKSDISQAGLNFILGPFDEVMVRKSAVYKEQINVFVEGEIMFPGRYTLSANTDKLSDLVKRAGGVKKTAYTDGAALIRKTYISKNNENNIASLNTAINKVSFESDSSGLASDLNFSVEAKPVGLQLSKALEKPGSIQDIILEDGDILKLPKYISTVQTFGAVNVPKQLIYTEGLSLKNAIKASGGFGPNASRKEVYIINANGEVKTTSRFLFFRAYPKINRGAEIHIPSRKAGKKSTGELVAISGSLVSLAGLIIALINTTK